MNEPDMELVWREVGGRIGYRQLREEVARSVFASIVQAEAQLETRFNRLERVEFPAVSDEDATRIAKLAFRVADIFAKEAREWESKA